MTTYATLVSDVASWSGKTNLTDVIPRMVALFENRVNRELRVRDMEASFSGTIASNVIAQPSNFLQIKRVWADNYPECHLKPQTLDEVRKKTQGVPNLYALDGSSIRFNGTGDVTGVYYRSIPSLQTDGYNWLSTNHYDAYLFGVMAEVCMWMKDPEGLQIYRARSNGVLDEIMGADKRLSGPLVARKA